MKEYTLVELTSSRIQYDKNPPKFMKWIILVIASLLIGIILLASFTYKTEVIRTSSIITSSNKVNIQSPNQGKIEKIYIENGDYVNKGDLLLKMDASQLDSQILALQLKCDYLKEYIDNYNLMINILEEVNVETLEDLENPFVEGQFYYEFSNVIKQIESITDNNGGITEMRSNTINQVLSSFYNTKFQYEYEFTGNLGQVEAYENLKKTYSVYATTSGYVNYNVNIKDSNVVDSSVLFTISEKLNKDNSIINTYVSATNRSFIDVGNDVEISIAGLSQARYGLLEGKVVNISEDVITDQDGNVFYSVDIKPNSIELINKDNKVEIVNGQICEIRIKYESITWMTWALTKIGILK